MSRYINGFNVSMFFKIKGKDLDSLREELRGSSNLIKGVSGYYWYNLDLLLSRFKTRMDIPEHLIKDPSRLKGA